jgi:hypothetical protein
MKRSRFKPEHIHGVPNESDPRTSVAELFRKLGISDATF